MGNCQYGIMLIKNSVGGDLFSAKKVGKGSRPTKTVFVILNPSAWLRVNGVKDLVVKKGDSSLALRMTAHLLWVRGPKATHT